MACGQGVVLALGRLGETGKTADCSDRRKLPMPAGDQLVGVSLIGSVPDQPVGRAVKDAMESERQLDGAKVRGQMSAALGDSADDRVATLGRQLRHFVVAEGVEIAGRFNAFDNGQK